MNKEVYARIKKEIMTGKKTKAQVAKELGVSYTHILNILKGKYVCMK